MTPVARAPLLSLDDAMERLLASASPSLSTEQVPVGDADGRVLAQDVVSALHVPPQDNSAMDGYALRCGDVVQLGTSLPVSQRIAAGANGQALQLGTVARIFTGAPVPAGADAVVMQEDCTVLPPSDATPDIPLVQVNTQPVPGQNIRRAGEDVARGDTV